MKISMVKFDYDKCIGCKKCYDLCPMDVIGWDEEKKRPYMTYPGECWMCGICWMECPKRTIDINYPCSLY